MAKTISLDPEKMLQQQQLLEQLTAKVNDGVSKMRAGIRDLEGAMRGGQGSAALAVLADLTNVNEAIRNLTDDLQSKLAQRARTVEEMQHNTSKFANLSDTASNLANKVRNVK